MSRGDTTYTAGTKKDNQGQGQELGSAFLFVFSRLQQDLFSHGA